MIFISVEQAVVINKLQIELFGGSIGVRDHNLLDAALEMPKQGFGDQYLHDFPFGMASAYLFHIVQNHPFLDGNKRTGLYLCLTFLDLNGWACEMPDKDLENYTVEIAQGKKSKSQIAELLEKYCVKIQDS